jgi:DNA-directed RNA polymerase sigma subunit (sigma70/sigma32)
VRRDGRGPGGRLRLSPHPDDLLRRYLEEAARQPVLGIEDDAALARSAHAGDTAAGETLVRGNLRLVAALAKRYAATGVPMLDLFQEGTLGLLQALESYDPDRGLSFRTYATWWIRQAIAEAASLPGPDLELRVQRAWDLFRGEHGRQPTIDELATAVGVDREQVADLLAPPPDLDPPQP